MKTSKWTLFACVLGLTLSACAPNVSTYVIPRPEGLYTAKGISSDPNAATEGALNKAHSTCFNQGKEAEVISIDTNYNGVNKDVKAVADIARTTAFMNGSNVFVPNLNRDDDHEVKIDFRCVVTKH